MVLYKHTNRLLFQVVFFIVAVIEVLLLSGITYGWASIVSVFEAEGFFRYLCNSDHDKSTIHNTTDNSLAIRNKTSSGSSRVVATCSLQSKRFNLVFNIAVACLCCSKFPIGLFIDRFGPRAGQAFGCCLYVMAGLGLAFVTKETSDLLFPIFIFFCIGGGFVAVSKYQMCRFYYVDVRSLVLSILHGAFDSSAIVLVFFKLTWEGGFSLRDISLAYTIIAFVIILLSSLFLTPPYNLLLEECIVKERTIKRNYTPKIGDKHNDHDVVNGNLDSDVTQDTLKDSILSPQYLLELMFMCFCQLRLWFFIGSLEELVTLHIPKHDFATIDMYVTYFGYAQLCGIFVGPWIGYVFDRDTIKCRESQEDLDQKPLLNNSSSYRIAKMQGSVLPFFLTNLLCVAFSILSLAPWKLGLIPSFVLHVLTRGFLYSAHASYIALAFQPERFATLYGLGIFVAGLFGLLEYPLYSIIYIYSNSDPFWVNLFLLFLVLASNIFPFYLIYHCKTVKKKLNTISCKFDRSSNHVNIRV